MFKESAHRKLWRLVKNSWNLVKKHGLVNTKIYLRKCYLNDSDDIPNSCYACSYAEQKQKSIGGLVSKCKYCPIDIGICGDINSVYRRICKAIVSDDKDEFEILCDLMINAKVKSNVECEVINNDKSTNNATFI